MLMRRPGFDPSLVGPHTAFLDELRARGLLEMSGGFGDRSGGAYLLTGIDSLEQAREIAGRDPLVIQGASDLAVHEWNTR
ncbi:hypothetical protein FZO89_01265 [Luteimonas viscosa]|uniref:YCII-related domain-containing protein n=1 Tax=Luteimonas viscosa TaxID=1132694 RepID=A0A5D4XTM7_9GAMM|nr:YciI family protein [Luteimonas viscosa]TYT27424.1 hypothetical protein FZO89_01265 [Luteimonas viscosa]